MKKEIEERKIGRRRKKLDHKDWWDRSCIKKKKEGEKNIYEMERRKGKKKKIHREEKVV